MATTIAPPKPREETTLDSGRGGFDDLSGGRGGDDGGGWRNNNLPPQGYRIGIWLAIASITMMFLALTSAYIVNRARIFPLEFPTVFWISTTLILACSLSIELARRALRRRLEKRFHARMWLTLGLGLGFLVAQLIAWRQLVASGYYLTTNRHSSYTYVFTALHAVHLVGGLLALLYVLAKSQRGRWTAIRRRVSLDATALYWHFLDGLWLYLLIILFIWR